MLILPAGCELDSDSGNNNAPQQPTNITEEATGTTDHGLNRIEVDCRAPPCNELQYGCGLIPLIPTFYVGSRNWKWTPEDSSTPSVLTAYQGTGDYYIVQLQYDPPPTNFWSYPYIISGIFMHVGSTTDEDMATVEGYECQLNQVWLKLSFINKTNETLILTTPYQLLLNDILYGTWYDQNTTGTWYAIAE